MHPSTAPRVLAWLVAATVLLAVVAASAGAATGDLVGTESDDGAENATLVDANEALDDDGTEETVDGVGDTTTGAVDHADDGTAEAVDHADDGTAEAVDHAGETTEETVGLTGNTTDETVGLVDGSTNETTLVNDTTDLVGNTTNDTVDLVDDTTNGATDLVGDTTNDTTNGAADPVGGTTNDTANGAADPGTAEADASATATANVSETGDEYEAGGDEEDDESGASDADRPDDGAGDSNAADVALVGLLGAIAVSGAAGGAGTAGGAGGTTARWLGDAGWRALLRRTREIVRWGPFGVFRYSRYDDSDPLENDRRRAIYATIEDAPGRYLAEVGERSGVPVSTVRHHVRVLEEERLVTSVKVGGKRRYFPAGEADAAELRAALAEPARRAVLEALSDLGSASNGRLADELGRDPSTVSHHLAALSEAGLVVRERDGRAVANELAPDVAAVLAGDGSESDAEGEVNALARLPADD